MSEHDGIVKIPLASNGGKGIALAIVSGRGSAPVEMIPAFVMHSWPTNTNLSIFTKYGTDTATGRNECVHEALRMGMKYIWFVDDDTVPPTEASRHLVYLLEKHGPAQGGKVMVSGGIYTTRSTPPEPIVYMRQGEGCFWNWKVGETFKCWGLGTGCMMINLEVFQHIPEPWFKTTIEAEKKETDDLYFCQRVAEAGFEVMAHGAILCHHYELKNGSCYIMPRDSAPFLNRVGEYFEPKSPIVAPGV